MSKTKIEWCHYTWNPVTGCDPVSESCTNCYARRLAEGRLRGRCGYDKDEPFKVTVHPDRMRPPNPRKPSVIFVSSMGDLYHEDVAPLLRKWVFSGLRLDGGIEHRQRHRFVLLTKRPATMVDEFFHNTMFMERITGDGFKPSIPKNLWLGVSVENQKRADERIPELLKLRPYASKLIVSAEPLLEQIVLPYCARSIDWLIVGAETGPGARYMNPDWAMTLRAISINWQIPFFMKQMSGREPIPKDLMVREWPE